MFLQDLVPKGEEREKKKPPRVMLNLTFPLFLRENTKMHRLSVSFLSVMTWLLVGGVFMHAVDPCLPVGPLPSPFHKVTLLKTQQPHSGAPEPFLIQRSSITFELLLKRSPSHNQEGILLRDCARVVSEHKQSPSHCASALLLPTCRQFFFPRQYYPSSTDDEPFLS